MHGQRRKTYPECSTYRNFQPTTARGNFFLSDAPVHAGNALVGSAYIPRDCQPRLASPANHTANLSGQHEPVVRLDESHLHGYHGRPALPRVSV